MLINLNFNLEAWVKQLAIEAASEEEAISKLMSMTLAEIVEEAANISSDIKITEVDAEITEYTVIVQVSDIEYDLDPEILDISVIEYLKEILPKELKLTLLGVTSDDEIEDMIKDEIFGITNYDVLSMNYKVLETK